MKDTKQVAFLNLYEPVHDSFERFCRARVYGDFEYRDLMNETLLIAYQRFEELRNPSAFLSFLIGTSIRILGSRNQKIREQRYHEAARIFELADPSQNVELDADIQFLFESMAKLKDNQRECLILFELSGFSIREIATLQGASEDAIKQRLKRARQTLTELMQAVSNHKHEGAV